MSTHKPLTIERIDAILNWANPKRGTSPASHEASARSFSNSDIEVLCDMALETAKLIEALSLIAAPPRADGTYNRDREACEQLAREVLKETE